MGCELSEERPSIVVTRFPSTRESGATQERRAPPSRWTVHAPHSAMPQPNLVPVKPRESRITHKRGVAGSSSTETGFPFSMKEVMKRLRGLSVDDWLTGDHGRTTRNGFLLERGG